MTISETREKILSDDEFVRDELKQFLTYYSLHKTIRYNQDRDESYASQSVAEHVYAPHLFCDYFLPLHPEIDALKVRKLLTWHDMAEAVVGDMTTKAKTDAHRDAELEAEQYICKNAPAHISTELQDLFAEFNSQETLEAQFAKALDKVEPMFYWYYLAETVGIKSSVFRTDDSGWEKQEYRDHREKFIANFPVLWKFDEVLSDHVYQAGVFKDSPC